MSSPTCTVFDGAAGYRLADISASRFFRHSVGGMHYHMQRFPDSLAARFLRDYKFPTGAGWRRHYNNTKCMDGKTPVSCSKQGFCQCYVPPGTAVANILRGEATSRSHEVELDATAAVHLRLGDVVDLSPFSLDEMLSRPTRFKTSCTKFQMEREGCLQVSPKVYVLPLSSYDTAIGSLRGLAINRVVVVGASSRNLTSHEKSCAYTQRVGAHFARHGFAVDYRLGRAPDDDLRFMARCKAVVPTGTSGFAQLVAAVAQELGHEVVMPAHNGTPVWSTNRFHLSQWTYEGNVVCGPKHERCRYKP